jgi:hypothetical protein
MTRPNPSGDFLAINNLYTLKIGKTTPSDPVFTNTHFFTVLHSSKED